MAITNPNLLYSATYDVYVDQTTLVIYKRKSRNRKTEITDEELVLLPLRMNDNRYIVFNDYCRRNIPTCISYIFADVFPDRVGDYYLHMLDPETFSELDHRDHVHDTYESNFPECLRWTSATINRADTSRTRYTDKDIDDKTAHRLKSRRDYYHKAKQDPEKLAKLRSQWAETKRRRYAKAKDQMKQWSADVNAEMQRRATMGQK